MVTDFIYEVFQSFIIIIIIIIIVYGIIIFSTGTTQDIQ